MKTCQVCKKPVSDHEWDIHTCSVQHCEAGPEFCPVCHKESKPTYGSEEVRKLREVIESQAEIIAELEQPTPVMETYCCQSCGAVIGSYPADYEEMECVDLECDSCGSKHGNTGCPAPDLAKQAIEKLAELGWKWDFDAAEFVSKQPAQQQEPVAWLVYENWRKHSLLFTKEGAEDFKNASQRNDDLSGNFARWRIEPLYTSPKPAPVQQEPEIEYCTNYHCAGDCGQPHNQKEMREFLAAAPQPAQPEPVRIYDYVWPRRDEHKEECVYACSYTPGHHLARGELLAVVHPSQLKNAYLQRDDESAPQPAHPKPLRDQQCLSIYKALNQWAVDLDQGYQMPWLHVDDRDKTAIQLIQQAAHNRKDTK